MKQFVRAGFLSTIAFGLLSSAASANTITVTPTPLVAGGGPYTWNYAVDLRGDSTIETGDFFTILDFDGYVAGSQNAPAGWNPSSANTGVCPVEALFAALCAAADDPSVPNLTWTRSGGNIVGPGPGLSTPLGQFTAQSIYNTPINGGWASQDRDNQTGTSDEGAAGGTNVPVAPIPEPASLLLLGSGLAAVAQARRKKKAQA
jgi:PEP-CTERM motif